MKDAKGHGSNSRGGSYPNIERSAFRKGQHVGYGAGTFRIQKGGPGYVASEQTTGERLTGVSLGHLSQQLSDRAAAKELANGHPKSDAVPVHDAHLAHEENSYNRDLALRVRDRQVGSGMRHR